MSLLGEIAQRCGTDKLSHGYCTHYDTHLWSIIDDPITLLEIGIQSGGSLLMWREWMPRATIIGVDLEPVPAYRYPLGDRILTYQSDVKAWDPEPFTFDVVVDDGSHIPEDVAVAFDRLWPRVKERGWYVIEDLDVNGPPALVTEAVKWLCHERGDVGEVHVYDQIAFLRKRVIVSHRRWP